MLRIVIVGSVLAAALVGLVAPLSRDRASNDATRPENAQSSTSNSPDRAPASSSTGAPARDDTITDAATLTLLTLVLLSGGDASDATLSEAAH